MIKVASRFCTPLLVGYLAACHSAAPPLAQTQSAALPVARAAPDLRSVNRKLQFTIGATLGPYFAPTFVYRGHPNVAPTLHVAPGDTIDLTLHNGLPPTNFTPDSLNIHFHGLNVPPRYPEDDALGMVARPGQTLHYVVRVPQNQPPGLYWYHPHSHGEAYWQVTSGMSGAIVVEGLRRLIPELAGAKEHILILRDEQITPNIFSIPYYARPQITAMEREIARRNHSRLTLTDPDDSPGHPCDPERNLQVTIEGTDDGSIDIASGRKQLFRVLNASSGRIFDLVVDGERLGLVGVDGYPIGSYPHSPNILWLDHIVVPPGGRAEFMVTGQNRASLLRSRCYDSGPAGDRDPEVVLAQLRPVAQSPTRPLPESKPPDIERERRLSLPAASKNRQIRLSEDQNGFYIDGASFKMTSMRPAIIVRSGTTEEWTIENETDEVHAFHIHQVHFVVTAVDGVPETVHYWRDTVLVPPRRRLRNKLRSGVVTILVDFRDPSIRGMFPFHCHMLDHEDGGMMAIVRVV